MSALAGPSRRLLASPGFQSLAPIARGPARSVVRELHHINHNRTIWAAQSQRITALGYLHGGAARRLNSSAESPGIEAPKAGSTSQRVAQVQPRLAMTFTCTANNCGHRSTHEFAKKSYEKGIVIVQCPECKSRHLIADHIGWFKDSPKDGNLGTVEGILKAKGEKIKKGKVNFDGDIEYVDE